MNKTELCQAIMNEINRKVRSLAKKREANVGLWRRQILDHRELENEVGILWERLRRMRSEDKRPFAMLDFSHSKLIKGKRAYMGI